MGMFDSMYDERDNEWQTKAYWRTMSRFRVGDEMPGPPISYQVEVFGGRKELGTPIESFATIHGGHLASINDERDNTLHLLNYHGGWTPAGEK